jgi:EpsI family protein
MRDYANAETGSAVNVFVAYFKSLQSGYGPHSPSVCLPGSGWLIRDRTIIGLSVPGRDVEFPVNKFVLEKAGQHILVLYWYQNDRNVWAQEFQGKLRLLPDLIKYQRSDVSLVRLVQALPGDDDSQALIECKQFTKVLFPALAEDFRRAD